MGRYMIGWASVRHDESDQAYCSSRTCINDQIQSCSDSNHETNVTRAECGALPGWEAEDCLLEEESEVDVVVRSRTDRDTDR